ncbi:hypothetical protein CEXT_809011 [Caerostris extrusa]|uniref:Uncharacterized protein n=1 Tax=Caerostris extrusa TaxID=172846 RepID=A0AAV4S388_CAEEX|nr:hypothetical protein CEXT_809011 [Caerostris extrusa]
MPTKCFPLITFRRHNVKMFHPPPPPSPQTEEHPIAHSCNLGKDLPSSQEKYSQRGFNLLRLQRARLKRGREIKIN